MKSLIALIALAVSSWSQSATQQVMVAQNISSTASYYCSSLTVDHTLVPSNTTGYTVGLIGTYSNLKSISNGGKVNDATNGYDIIFSSDSAGVTLLNWEKESWDATTGASVFWFKPTATLSSTVDTIAGYVCFGNASIVSFQGGARGSAWDSDYVLVMHGAVGALAFDSTSNANDGTLLGSTGTPVAGTGKVGGGLTFVGANSQYVLIPVITLPFSGFTVEVWAKPNLPSNCYCTLSSHNWPSGHLLAASNGGASWAFFYESTFTLDNLGTRANGTWAHLVGSYDGTNERLYQDGALLGSPAPATPATVTFTGAWGTIDTSPAGGSAWTGDSDELRWSKITRSADWILLGYNNMNSPSSFVTVGTAVGH